MEALSNAANALSSTILDNTIKQWLTAMQAQLQTWAANWMQTHPIAAWFTTHPLISVGLILVSLILFKGLFDAIGELIARLWLALLNAPVRLLRFGIRNIRQRLQAVTASSNTTDAIAPEQQLAQLLQRLDTLRAEQDQVIQEVRSLLVSTPIQLKPHSVSAPPLSESANQLAFGGE